MDEGKQDDTENIGSHRSVRVYETVRGKVESDGSSWEYSYTVVYTQESVWVLDMRSVPAVPGNDRFIRGLLGTRVRNEGYDSSCIRFIGGGREGLNG